MPVRFTSTTACHFSNGRSSIGTAGAPMPALLKSTSSRPQPRRHGEYGLDRRGVGDVRLEHRARDSSDAVCRRLPEELGAPPDQGTRAPSRSIASAAALPMPVPAPVMSTTFPSAAMRRSIKRCETRCALVARSDGRTLGHRLRRIPAVHTEPRVAIRVLPGVIGVEVDEAALDEVVAHLEDVGPASGV